MPTYASMIYNVASNVSSSDTNKIISNRMVSADGLVAYAAVTTFNLTAGPGYLSITLDATGSGYSSPPADVTNASGDLTVSGGTPSANFSALTLRYAESGGNITSLNPYYAVFPGEILPFATSPVTTSLSLTVNFTFSSSWTNGPDSIATGPSIHTAGSGATAGEIFEINLNVYNNLLAQPAFGQVSTVSGSVPTAIYSNSLYQPDTNLSVGPLYDVSPPGSTANLVGGGGSGATVSFTFTPLGSCAPRLVKWDLVAGAILIETTDFPFSADDLSFGSLDVRGNDGHIFTINGRDTLYHLDENLNKIGSYAAPFIGSAYLNPWQWMQAAWIPNQPNQLTIPGNPTTAIAVGADKAYVAAWLDRRGRIWGIDVFDISGTNPSYLRSLNWPIADISDSFTPGGPISSWGSGQGQPLRVHAATDTLYTPVINSSISGTPLVLYKAGPTDTSLSDVTPWLQTDYTFGSPFYQVSFVIDQVNDVALFVFTNAAGNGYSLVGYSIPGLIKLWQVNTPIGEIIHTDGAAENIVSGQWWIISSLGGIYTLNAYDTLTGAIGQTITSPPGFFAGGNQGFGFDNFGAIAVDSLASLFWMPLDNFQSSPYRNQAIQLRDTSPPPPPPILQKWLGLPAFQQFFDDESHALIGGQIFTDASGTPNNLATYTSASGQTHNPNPEIANARGEMEIWLPASVDFDMTLAPADDTDPPTNPIWTVLAVGIEGLIYWPQVSFPGTPTASELIYGDDVITTASYAANFLRSRFYAKTAPTLDYTITVYLNDQAIGTIFFPAGANFASTFTYGSVGITVRDGNRFELIGQLVPDATIAGIYGTFLGTGTVSGWP